MHGLTSYGVYPRGIPSAPFPLTPGKAGLFDVRFSGEDGFTATLAPDNLNSITRNSILKTVEQGIPLPLSGEYTAGVLYPNGTIRTSRTFANGKAKKKDTERFTKMVEYVYAHFPKERIPKEGLSLVIQARNAQSIAQVKQFLDQNVIPCFKFEGKIIRQDDKDIAVQETVTWPFFKALMAGETMPQRLQEIRDKVDSLPLYQIHSPDLSQEQNTLLRKTLDPLKAKLVGLELAKIHYVEKLDIREVIASLTKGAIVGGGGEFTIHHTVPESGLLAGVLRSLLLVVVDTIDNFYGEMGVLTSNLEANGLKLSKESVFGEKNWRDILKKRFKMDGPGGILAKRAVKSAGYGAGSGAILAVPTGITLSGAGTPTLNRALVGAAGAIGTATAIPFNMRATFPQAYAATIHLIREGKIVLPEGVDKKQFARTIAEQELLARLGFSTSMRAFSLVPISGGILALEMLGVPREVVQFGFMALAPTMENMLRLVFTINRLKHTLPRDMRKAERLLLNQAEKPFSSQQEQQLKRLFADNWSKHVLHVLTGFPRKVKLPVEDSDIQVLPKNNEPNSSENEG